jgi:N-acetylmuramoyl-L-alanine amidase
LTGVGVLHTTESSGVQSALASLKAKYSAPHFIVGEHRIIQCRPVGVQAAALVDPANRRAFIQIECVGYTGGVYPSTNQTTVQPWQFVDSTLRPLVALLAYCNLRYQIPLVAPLGWKDDLKDCPLPWATKNNARRRRASLGAWNTEKGWWMHLEIPFNSHHDCGRLRRSEILQQAQTLVQQS